MKKTHPDCLSFIKRHVCIFVVLLCLTACGGGSSITSTAPTPALATTPTLQNLTTAARFKQVTITWNEITGASGYNLYYATQSLNNLDLSNPSAVNAMRAENISSPYIQTGLNNAQEYFFVVSVLSAAGESVISNVVSATPAPNKPLNDTGITRCANETAFDLDCSDATTDNFPNQDAENGRDALATASPSTLSKIGDGVVGFDFSRLKNDGAVLTEAITSAPINWSCVRDNHTGLIWEVKTDNAAADLHDRDHTYSWFEESNNGGNQGTENRGSCFDQINNNCDTRSYVKTVNTAGLCGASDWRMPTRQELHSLVNYSIVSSGNTIDTNYFSNNNTDSLHWSSSPNASNSSDAWHVDFLTGFYGGSPKFNSAHIRLVRSGQ